MEMTKKPNVFQRILAIRGMGQVFTVTTAVGTLWYEVDDIREIEPWEIEEIAADPDRDTVTLMTCTPIGINTHRLLVTGHRIDGPLNPDPQILSFWVWPGPPWPAIWWLIGVTATYLVGRHFHVVRPAKRAARVAAGLPASKRRRKAKGLPQPLPVFPELQGA